jgi:hypothetical protein
MDVYGNYTDGSLCLHAYKVFQEFLCEFEEQVFHSRVNFGGLNLCENSFTIVAHEIEFGAISFCASIPSPKNFRSPATKLYRICYLVDARSKV